MKLSMPALRSIVLLAVLSTAALGASVGCAAPSASAEETSIGEAALTGQERAAVMNGLRAKLKPELANQDIVFNVSNGSLRVENGYAFIMGRVELRRGGEPTTAGTIYEESAREGLFDGFRVEALLKQQGDAWKVLEHGLGSTDVWYWGIEDRYSAAPRSIFPWLDGQGLQQVAPAERKAIMNSLRATVRPELANQDVVFNVSQGAFNVGGDYCWLQGSVELRSGGEPTTVGTIYQEDAEQQCFDGFRLEALLKKDGTSWKVVEHAIGATEAWYVGLAGRYPDAPIAIFPEIAR